MERYFEENAILSLFSKNYMDLKKDLPIRPSEMGLLNILCARGGEHTPVLLAELLGVSKPMITAHIHSLAAKGYVTKQPCLQDKRAYYVLPTPKAETLVKAAKKETEVHLQRLIAAMGQSSFEALVRLADEANHILMQKGE